MTRTTLEAHSKALAAKPLKFHPGEGYSYGTSIDVLGRYIEVVSGKPLDVFLKERVLGPLKMVDTDFWVVPDKAGRIASSTRSVRRASWNAARGGPTDHEAHAVHGRTGPVQHGGGLRTVLPDAAPSRRTRRRRVLKSETVDLMFQNHLKHRMKYGLGGAVDGEGGYGWGGANGTQFCHRPQEQLLRHLHGADAGLQGPGLPRLPRLGESKPPCITGEDAGAGMSGGGGRGAAGSQQRDKNNDGKLDRSELSAALFDRLDADKDGFVTEEEAKTLWQAR